MDITVTLQQQADDYQRIEQAILYLQANTHRQPGLQEVAESVHLSEYHFQRLFTRWAGISPKRFLQYLTKEHARRLLEQSASLLETAYAVGLSGPGRLHDLFITCEAVTPGEYKQRGAGLSIRYGFHPSPFGECLLAVTERGICSLSFTASTGRPAALAELRSRWPKANLAEDQAGTRPLAQQVFEPQPSTASQPLPLFLSGSNFQLKVWEALLRVPAGSLASYEDIARWLGMPRASRAVSGAVARNPVAYLIPCHRVIRKLGEFGGYHYGAARKQAILGWEMAHSA